MKLIDMTCPHCSAHLKVDASKAQAICEHCGATILIDDEVQHIQYDNAEEAGYNFEKGRQRAKAEARREAATAQHYSQQNTKPPKKRRTWLWVLGWIFIFPLPLTILLLRKKEMKPALKYGIIAAAWIIYLIIGLAGGSGSNKENPNETNQPSSSITEPSSDATPVTSVPDNSETPSATESTESSEPVSTVDVLGLCFERLTESPTKENLEAFAKELGLYESHRNKGTGTYEYRIATERDVANVNKRDKGSVIKADCNALKGDEIPFIQYFDYDRMIEGTWHSDGSFSLVDYNNPDNAEIEVNSAQDIINFLPTKPSEANLLEILLASAYEGMTEEEVLGFVEVKGLSYDSRGAGNERSIGYSRDVIEKYGDWGSKITFSTSNGLLERMTYYYFPSNYREGVSAVFYSESYAKAHSVTAGFNLQRSNGTTPYSKAGDLLNDIHGKEIALPAGPDGQKESESSEGAEGNLIDSFVYEFNMNSETPLVFKEDFTPSDKTSGHYRTEFRLGAYKDAVGKSFSYEDVTVDIVFKKPMLGNGNIRVYMDGATLDQCKKVLAVSSPIMDETATSEDIQEAVDYISERKETNGYYYANLGLLLLGNDTKGYEFMLKMGND